MGAKRKPSQAAILAATPLSILRPGDDRMAVCNVCGEPSDSLRIWREHDEWDRPVGVNAALVFIGNDHPKCVKAMENHSRLYAEEAGLPGNFPRLCGPCTYRQGLECTHPKLRQNGGPGLLVHLSDPFKNAILCGRGGRIIPIRPAITCEGLTTTAPAATPEVG